MVGGDWFSEFNERFFSNVPQNYKLIIILASFTALIVLYSVFIYYFYRFLARKNVISLDLNKYNKYQHPVALKFFGFIFYVLEYIIILPIITFFWFGVFSIFLLLLARGLDVMVILTIAAALIASVRVTSYITENLSRDLAKMLPFTLLGLSIIDPDFFKFDIFFKRIAEIPSLIQHIPYFLVFIVALELLMRLFDLVTLLFRGGEDSEVEIES